MIPRSSLPLRRAFTLVELLVVIAIFGVLLALTLVAVQAIRSTASRLKCSNNLRQLGIAFHAHHDLHGRLPPGVTHPTSVNWQYGVHNDPYPLLNWGARLLPLLEQEALWATIDRAYQSVPPGDTPSLRLLATDPVPVFLCPSDPALRPNPPRLFIRENCNYLGISGRSSRTCDGVLYLDSTTRLTDILDGTSNTLLVSERPLNEITSGGRWQGGWGARWGPADAYLGVRETMASPDCPEVPYPFQRSTKRERCSAFHFWSFHPGGANTLFCGGSVRFLPCQAAAILPQLASRDGGEVVTAP